jgi:hypothetical protein
MRRLRFPRDRPLFVTAHALLRFNLSGAVLAPQAGAPVGCVSCASPRAS